MRVRGWICPSRASRGRARAASPRQFPRAAHRLGGQVGDALADLYADLRDGGDGVGEPGRDGHPGFPFRVEFGDRHPADADRSVAVPFAPLHPFADGGPGLPGRSATHDESEMPCA